MCLKGTLQQQVPVHNSIKRSQLPFSNNFIVRVVEVKAIAKRGYDLEQRMGHQILAAVSPSPQQAGSLTHIQDSQVKLSSRLLPLVPPYSATF